MFKGSSTSGSARMVSRRHLARSSPHCAESSRSEGYPFHRAASSLARLALLNSDMPPADLIRPSPRPQSTAPCTLDSRRPVLVAASLHWHDRSEGVLGQLHLLFEGGEPMTRRQQMKDRARELLRTLRSPRLVVVTMLLEGFTT